MRNLFSYDGPVFAIINRLSNIIVLNVLWLICCIPIITAGASTTALYFVSMKLVEGEDAHIARDFFRSFKENFFQGTLIWIGLLLFGAFIVYDLYIALYVDIGINNILVPVTFFFTMVYAMIFVYIFALQSKFVNKIRHTIKNAIILSLRHLPWTFLLIAGHVLESFLIYKTLVDVNLFATLLPVWIFFGVALFAYGFSFIYVKIFHIYIKAKKETEDAVVEDTNEGIPSPIDTENE